jgi:hypothetical protein
MKPENIHPRCHRRALPVSRKGAWATALLVLFTLGSGAALADDHRGDRRGYQQKHERSRDHRADRDRHERRRYDQRHDRRRYDQRNDRQRYDRRRDDNRSRYDRQWTDRGRRYDDRYRYNNYRSRTFSVPRVIVRNVVPTYRPYYFDRVYYPAHHHYHEIYRFPVYLDYGVEYYPYAYCEGNFFGRGIFRDGRAFFDIHIRF